MNTMFADRIHLKDLEQTLANSTALLAVVGAGDLAVEKIRAAREQLTTRSASFDPKAFREQAQATILDGVETLQSEMQAAPEQIRALPERAQEWPAKAQALFADVMAGAFTTYGDLAGRGKNVVGSARGEQPDVQPVKPVSRPATSTAKKPAARKTSSTATSAKSASASKKSTPRSSTKSSAATSSPAKSSPAKSSATKSSAGKTAARKSSATKPSAGKTAARKSATAKSTTAKSTTSKS